MSDDPKIINLNGNSATVLRRLVERIENLEEEKRAIAADIKEVYAEAKGSGFDTKALRKVIAQRRQDQQELEEQQAMIDLYLQVLSAPAGEGGEDEEDML